MVTVTKPLNVLLVEDRDSDARLAVRELRAAGYEPTWKRVDTESEYLSSLEQFPDVILADFSMPQFDAMRALELLQERELDIPFIIVSGTIGEDLAVEALQRGAQDYLLKDRLGRLGSAVEQALQAKRLRQSQRQAQEQLHLQSQALAAAANGILITDKDGSVLWANPAFSTLTGYALDEVLGKNPRFLKSDRHEPLFYEDLWQTIVSGRVWKGEEVNRRKDGSEYDIEQVITPVRNADGAITRFIAIQQDISDRKRAEAVLRERSSLATLTADVGLALTTSFTLREMLELCTGSLVRNLGAAFARVWTLNERENVLELQASSGLYTHIDGPHGRVPVGKFKIGLIAQQRQPLLTNDVLDDPRIGDRKWARREGLISFAGYPLVLDDRLVGVVAIFARQPLNEATLDAMAAVANQIALGIVRKRTEDSLRATNEKLKSLVRASPLAIVAVDPDLKVLEWNPAALRIFGWTEAEVLGEPIPIIPEAEKTEIRAAVRAERASELPTEQRVQRLKKDGSLVDVSLWSAPLCDSHGGIVGSLRLMADITERIRLEDQFRQAQKMEAVGRLAGGVAHDFNNLLTVIGGFADVALEGLDPSDGVAENIQEIKKASDRAASLTRQLLAFSRRQILASEIVDLNTLILDTQKMLSRLLGEDVELRLALADGLGRIEADPGQIEQILMNLAVNARDAMPTGGQLVIETRNLTLDSAFANQHFETHEGEYVLLAVTDTGIGMDAATQSHIFEPFFTTKSKGKGTGLGLATIYGIVKQSHGSISVYSEPGQGTSFKIYFPRVGKSASNQLTTDGRVTKLQGTETILLAEDEDMLRGLAVRVLAKNGYQIVPARNGAEAIEQLETYAGPIHLLVTDVIMPKASGREVAEHAAQKFPAMKVLYISGYTDDAVVLNGVLAANVAFLQKPFSPDTLVRKVRQVLDS